MRMLIMSGLLALVALPAAAQTQMLPSQAALKTWDECVGASAQDYVDMFGAVSMDDDKLNKAVEDCWDEEYKYQQAVKQNPELSDGVMDELFIAKKAEIRSKWYDVYVKNRKNVIQASTK